MRELSPKIVIYASFISVILILTGACIAEPVDLDDFLEDPIVQGIIEKGNEKVALYSGSESYLIAGNGKISGLKTDKYYTIEEYNESNVSQGIKFVKPDGTVTSNIGEVARVPGGEIKGLNNNAAYKVNEAKPLYTTSTALEYIEIDGSIPSSISGSAQAAGGAISLPKLVSQSSSYYLNTKIDAEKNYQIVMLDASSETRPWGTNSRTSAFMTDGTITAITDASYTKYKSLDIGIYQHRGNPTPAYLENMSLILLRGEDTVTDYIIAEYDTNDVLVKFNVLTVSIVGSPKVTINLNYSGSADNSPVVVTDTDSYSQSDGDDITITFTVQNQTNYSDFQWYVNGIEISPNGNNFEFIMNFSEIQYKIIGIHYIIAAAKHSNGEWYSTTVVVTVNE